MTIRLGACLSLSGRYARFGAPAGQALRVWQAMADDVELIVVDDRSSTRTLRTVLPRLARRCDLLVGPYSTRLAAAAGDIAADADLLLWNHGGAGDDVQAGHPGHVVSVPTPASRYAEPYLRHLARVSGRTQLWITHGTGRFGEQAAVGAARRATQLGIDALPADSATGPRPTTRHWDLFTAGSFDEDVRMVNHVQALPHPPNRVCAVAAGVAEFRHAVARADGIFGISQWTPGAGRDRESTGIGPAEADFLSDYIRHHGTTPDYPAVQAVAAAIIATHCAGIAGATTREPLWAAATALRTPTLFGSFRIDPITGVQLGHETVMVRW